MNHFNLINSASGLLFNTPSLGFHCHLPFALVVRRCNFLGKGIAANPLHRAYNVEGLHQCIINLYICRAKGFARAFAKRRPSQGQLQSSGIKNDII
eukprot:1149959-Pelagomonas_calceolata.AAC.10